MGFGLAVCGMSTVMLHPQPFSLVLVSGKSQSRQEGLGVGSPSSNRHPLYHIVFILHQGLTTPLTNLIYFPNNTSR